MDSDNEDEALYQEGHPSNAEKAIMMRKNGEYKDGDDSCFLRFEGSVLSLVACTSHMTNMNLFISPLTGG